MKPSEMNFLRKFFNWYENHLLANTTIAAILFALQLIHLFWLTTDVVIPRLGFESVFPVTSLRETLLILVDYTEIPALITTSLVYINAYRKKYNIKSILYLIFLNSQWLHLFWITDEFVLEQFAGDAPVIFPFWVAWMAILIDYLELPVIFDTIKKTVVLMTKRLG